MSRGYTPRHAQTAGDLSFAVQFNAETGISHSSAILRSDSPQSNNKKDHSLWVTPFTPRERPNVKHAIAGYLRLPQPTSAPALMQVLHWLCCWAKEPGYATGNPPEDYSQIRGGCSLDDCCRLVLPYNAEHSIQQTGQIPNDPPRMGAKNTTTSNHPSTPFGKVIWSKMSSYGSIVFPKNVLATIGSKFHIKKK